MPSCAQCSQDFAVTAYDQRYYREWGVPEPLRCPDCRHQQRCAYRNERALYKRECALCKRSIVTVYRPQAPYPVLCSDCWYGDKWDPRRLGRDFDFNRPFFEQFHELKLKVPRLALANVRAHNSEYCNLSTGNKDCYLCFAADDNQDCMYSYWINRCEDTFNSSYLCDCRQCIECIDGENLHRCIYSQQMKNCAECIFCFDMIGCKNCFGCSGLRNAEYFIYNQPVKKEEYHKRLAEVFKEKLSNRRNFKKLKQWFRDMKTKTPRRFALVINSEDCTGDYISGSRNCRDCYDIFDSEQCRYCYFLVHKCFNLFDISSATEARNCYQGTSIIGEGIRFAVQCWYSSNILYSDSCLNSEELFGCAGINKINYCVFNKKYTPDEYKTLRNQIVAHMQKTGEWGQFFPIQYSPFPYNDTVANDYFPMEKEEVLRNGWQWADKEDMSEKQDVCGLIPEDIKNVKDDILNQKLTCRKCHKSYRIMKRELKMYRTNYIPLPETCPDCRYRYRLTQRNPYKLYDRPCDKCQRPVQTTYSADPEFNSGPETVFCDKCYYQAMY